METFYTTHANGEIRYAFTPESDNKFMRLVIATPQGEVMITERQVYWMRKDYRKTHAAYIRREYEEAPRMYVGVDNEETVLENIMNRTRRPYSVFKSMTTELFNFIGLDIAKTDMSWRQNAGCKMCPCSPGFVLYNKKNSGLDITLPDNTVVNFKKYDIWVTLNNAPAVDENAPERNVEVLF